MEKETMQLMIN